jgi:hypothetical protein
MEGFGEIPKGYPASSSFSFLGSYGGFAAVGTEKTCFWRDYVAPNLPEIAGCVCPDIKGLRKP